MVRCLVIAAAFAAITSRVEAATLTGTVSWSQPKPAAPIAIARDQHVCGASGPIRDRELDFDDHGRIAGAIVYLEGIDQKPAPGEVVFDQKNCVFIPRAAAVTVGSVIVLTSSDPVLHTVHISDGAGKSIASYAMPVMGQKVSFRAKSPGLLELRCEAGHSWMRGSLLVLEHPLFARTGERGAYAITGVPVGTHRVVAWHPELGRVERTIIVPESGKPELRLDLAF